MQSLTTCLMFVGDQFGKADEAMNLYASLFEDSRVVDVERFGAGHVIQQAFDEGTFD